MDNSPAVQEGTFAPNSAISQTNEARAPVRPAKLELHGFKIGSSTNPETAFDNRGRSIEMPDKESDFTPETRAKYQSYIEGHLQRLIRLQQTLPRQEFNRLYGPRGEHVYDKMLFDELTMLSTEGAGERGRVVDKSKIEAFLNTDRGMGVAYMTLQSEFDLESAGTAVYASIQPPVSGPELQQSEQTLMPDGGTGRLRRGVEAVGRRWRRPIRQVRGRANPNQGPVGPRGPGGVLHGRGMPQTLMRPNTVGEAITQLSALTAEGGVAGGAAGELIAMINNNVHNLEAAGVAGFLSGAAMTGIGILMSRSLRRGESFDVVQCAAAFRTIAGRERTVTETLPDMIPDPANPGGPLIQRMIPDPAGGPDIPGTIDIQHRVLADNAETKWLKEFIGYEVNDIEIVGNQVQMREGVAPETLADRGTRINRLKGHAQMLLAFQKENGIQRTQRMVSPIERLVGDTENFPQSGSDIDQRVNRHFNINRDGERDMNGNARLRRVNGQWVRNDAFNENNLDEVGNAQRYRKAYRKAMVEEITLAYREMRDTDTPYRANLLAEIDAKAGKTGANSPDAKARIAEINKLLGTAEAPGPQASGESDEEVGGSDQAEIGRLTDGLGGLQEQLQVLDQQEAQRDAIANRFTRGTPPAAIPADDLRREIRALMRSYPAGGAVPAAIEVDRETITSLHERQTQLDTEINDDMRTNWLPRHAAPVAPTTAAPVFPPSANAKQTEAYNSQLAAYREEQNTYLTRLQTHEDSQEAERQRLRQEPRYQSVQQEIDDDRKMLQSAIEALNNIDTTERNTRAQLQSRDVSNQIRADAEGVITDTQEAIRSPLLQGITRANLRNMSMDQLLEQINTGYNAGPPVRGWERRENLDPRNRDLLIRAMTEARVRTATNQQFRQAIDPNIWGLGEYDFLTMDTQSILDRMTQRAASGIGVAFPTMPSDTEVDAMRLMARTRMSERAGALIELEENRETQTHALERELQRLTEEGVATPELAGIRRYVDRYGSIDNAIRQVDLGVFLEAGDVNRAPNSEDYNRYAAYENGASRAYVQMMRLMFDHSFDTEAKFQNRQGEQAAFQRNQRIVSPEQLYRELNRYFDLRAGNFDQAVTRLRNRARQGTLSQENLRFFFTEVMLYGETGNNGFIQEQVRRY